MKVLKVILGVIMIICAFSMLAMPALNTVLLCWMLSIFMLVGGIVSIIRFIEDKNAEKVAKKNGQPYLKTGIGSLIFGIVAIVLSILSRSSLEGGALFVKILSVLFGLWIVLDGVSMIIAGSNLKKLAASGWLAMMILGVLLVIAGIICIVDTFTGLTTFGVMLSLSVMMAGFGFIFD